IFSDDAGRFNLSLLETGREALVVSQFTLLADARRGRRPSFAEAAPPEQAEPLVEALAAALREAGIATQTGRFGARMQVELVNEGPVTIVVDNAETWSGRGGADSAANFVDNRRLGARFCAFGFTFAPGLRCLDQE